MKSNHRKIRILYIHPTLEYGGAEDQRLTLLENWNLSGYDVSILCIEKIGDIGERIKDLGIKVYCLNQSSKPYNLKATVLMFLFLLRHRFDIVQTALFNANLHGRLAAFLARVPIVFSEEHSEHYQYNSVKFLPYLWTDRMLSLLTDKIICCCESLKKDILRFERITSEKFISILSVINFEKLRITTERIELRKRLGISESDFVIGNVSSMSLRKGQEYLIRAFYSIKRVMPSARLVLVGQEIPSIKKKLIELAQRLDIIDSVSFLGRQDNIADFYNIMDIFVLSSLYEGIPLVVAEAIYMKVPVIATDIGGIQEMIEDDRHGFIVPSMSPDLLAERVIFLHNNKERRIDFAEQAFNEVVDRFRPERYLSDLNKIYQEYLLKKRIS